MSMVEGQTPVRATNDRRFQYLCPMSSYLGPPAPLQTELSRFCEMKYLLEKETHNKNEDNTLNLSNSIWFAKVNFYQNTTKT
jgi:hypothetical protein